VISHPLLDQLGQTGIRLGLERIRSFLTAVGEPHRAFPVVHVAGTNGKGSVCAMVTTALVRAGYRVGTTISPHVEEVNERVQIDGVPVDDATLTEVLEAVDRARWEWARAVGVELQAPLVEQARVSAAALGLDRVTFRRGDAATTEVPDGTVFFSYASLSPPALERTLAVLEQADFADEADLERRLRALAEELGLKAGQLFMPIRVAVTGRTVSPGLFETLRVLGRERSLERLARAREKLAAYLAARAPSSSG